MEKDIESYLRKRVTAAGGLALKLVCPGFTGVPDRLIRRPRLLRGVKGHWTETAHASAACTWYAAEPWFYGLRSRQQGRR